MSVNPVQSWLTPDTSLFAGGGAIETPQTINMNVSGDVSATAGPPAGSIQWLQSTGTTAVNALSPAYWSGASGQNWTLSYILNATPGGTNDLANMGMRGTLYGTEYANSAGFGYVGSDTTSDTVKIAGFDNNGNGTYEYWRSQNGTIGISSPSMTITTNNLLMTAIGGGGGVRILPSTNQINVQNLNFVSTISPIGTGGVGSAGTINMTELASSIKGYGWAQVL
jgi:hypothetical protein